MNDEKYMRRALILSKKGIGFVNPNPLVGAVIVKNNEIIGEGYHAYYGGPHAEVNAIKNAVTSVEGATMYVTLEPCVHYGKTPPCTDLIIKEKIAKVVVGMTDPNIKVGGLGIEKLRKNKVAVIEGVLEKEILEINEVFIKHIVTEKPFVVMKFASSLDGKIATSIGESKWISSEGSRKHAHMLRHRYSGIMVGINTVMEDDPMLTDRMDSSNPSNPTRIIVDSKCRISLESKIVQTALEVPTIIAVTEKADSQKIKSLEALGLEVIVVNSYEGQVELKTLLHLLGVKDIDSILLEGGSTLNFSMLNEKLVDKVIAYIAPKIIGGKMAKTPVDGKGFETMDQVLMLKNKQVELIDEDVLIQGYL